MKAKIISTLAGIMLSLSAVAQKRQEQVALDSLAHNMQQTEFFDPAYNMEKEYLPIKKPKIRKNSITWGYWNKKNIHLYIPLNPDEYQDSIYQNEMYSFIAHEEGHKFFDEYPKSIQRRFKQEVENMIWDYIEDSTKMSNKEKEMSKFILYYYPTYRKMYKFGKFDRLFWKDESFCFMAQKEFLHDQKHPSKKKRFDTIPPQFQTYFSEFIRCDEQ